MTLVVADGAKAYCAFLRAAVGSQLAPASNPKSPGVVVPAVFRPAMPQWFDKSMPASAVVVRPRGGYTQFGDSTMYLADPRMDVIAYGTTQQDATSLATLIAVTSKQLVNEVWENTLLMAANISGGPIPLPDTQTLWPACWLSVQLVHGELLQPPGAG
jgi:hypothetical protein